MAFRLDLSPTYRWPVRLKVPGEDGTMQDAHFNVDFVRLKQSEVAEIAKQAGDGNLTDSEFARRVVKGLPDIEDGAGNPIPFSMEALDKVCEIVGVQAAIVRAWFESISEGAQKNS